MQLISAHWSASTRKNPVDNVLVPDVGDDGSTRGTINFNVDTEYSPESLGSCHGGMALSQ